MEEVTRRRLMAMGAAGALAVFSFYRNLPDTMARIPFAGSGDGVRGNLVGVNHAQLARAGGPDLTGPIGVGAPAGFTPVHLWETLFAGLHLAGNIPPDGLAFFARQVAMFFTSGELRRFGQWEYASWWDFVRAGSSSEEYRKQLADGLTRNLAAAKPKDMSVNSTGIVGESFVYALTYRPDGPADRILNAPTNEAWIDPWLAHLRGLGVTLREGVAIDRLETRKGRIAWAVADGERIEADHFVCAVPVERARKLFRGAVERLSPELQRLSRVRTAWMNGVIFHLDREAPVCDGHVSYVDAPWALTSISQAQHWARDLPSGYGDGRARESFSTIISDFTAPGMLYGKPAWSCTREEIVAEVWAQCQAHLNDTGQNQLPDGSIVSAFVDPGIRFPRRRAGSARIAVNDDPLLINTPGSWDDRPTARTGVPNLFLAGDYVRSSMNVATMESACETGRAAAQAVLDGSGLPREPVDVIERWTPPENESFKAEDDRRYRAGQPHVLDFPWPERRALGLRDGSVTLRDLLGR